MSKSLGRWGAVCGLLVAGIWLAGCHSGTASDSHFADLPGLSGPAAPPAPAADPAPADANSDNPLDMLHKGQAITITFQDLPQIVPPIQDRIKEDGTITLLQNQTFVAAGKARGALEKEIRERYVPNIFKTMTVTVQPQVQSQFYYVGGEVKLPNRQVYLSRIHVLAAIQSSGDFTDFANKRKVRLTRADGRIFIVNCVKARQDPKLDIEVYPGDTIYVPRRWF